jgi:hypothetical protein
MERDKEGSQIHSHNLYCRWHLSWTVRDILFLDKNTQRFASQLCFRHQVKKISNVICWADWFDHFNLLKPSGNFTYDQV